MDEIIKMQLKETWLPDGYTKIVGGLEAGPNQKWGTTSTMADSLNMASDSVTDQDGSSDTVYDSPCKPCADEDRNTKGTCLCFQCQTCFCQTCVRQHNKFFKTHSLFYKTVAKSQNVQQQSELACDIPGLCKGVDNIPKLAKETLKGRDRTYVKASLERLKKDLKAAKASKVEEINQAAVEKDGTLTEIDNMTERIIARVSLLKQASVKEVQNRYDTIADHVKYDVMSIDKILACVEGQITKIDQFSGNDEAKLFVLIKKAHEQELECMTYLEHDVKVLYDKISFKINHKIEDALNDMESLGILKDTGIDLPRIKPAVSSVSRVEKYNVRLACDGKQCCIVDTCILDDGHIVMADGSNHVLKRLDKAYNLKDSFSVSGLTSFCKTGSNELAVTAGDMIHFVHVGRSMVSKRSLDILKNCKQKDGKFIISEEKYLYRDVRLIQIVFDDDKLYICANLCDRLEYYGILEQHMKVEKCIRNVVFVYDLRGSHIRTILPENIGKTNHFSMSLDGSCLYIATFRRFITLNKDGKVLSIVTDERLQIVNHVTEGDNGELYVCGKDSSNVFLLDKHGKIVDEILGRYDGIESPISLMYIKHQRKLLVAGENQDSVKIFHMH